MNRKYKKFLKLISICFGIAVYIWSFQFGYQVRDIQNKTFILNTQTPYGVQNWVQFISVKHGVALFSVDNNGNTIAIAGETFRYPQQSYVPLPNDSTDGMSIYGTLKVLKVQSHQITVRENFRETHREEVFLGVMNGIMSGLLGVACFYVLYGVSQFLCFFYNFFQKRKSAKKTLYLVKK